MRLSELFKEISECFLLRIGLFHEMLEFDPCDLVLAMFICTLASPSRFSSSIISLVSVSIIPSKSCYSSADRCYHYVYFNTLYLMACSFRLSFKSSLISLIFKAPLLSVSNLLNNFFKFPLKILLPWLSLLRQRYWTHSIRETKPELSRSSIYISS